LGHEVVLIPPQYVKPYVQRGKNDKIDAEAICEAMSRPKVQERLMPVKTVEQQAALTMLGVRDLLVKQRTILINAIRGYAAEFGVTAAKGPPKVTERLQRLAADEGVPALAREMINQLAGQIDGLNAKLKAIDARIMAWHKQSQKSQLLATVPGIGPIAGASFALKSLPSRKRGCRSPRYFARAGTSPPIGIAPREHSTGGRQQLGRISKEGDENLRRLLVLGATAVIQQAKAGRASPRVKPVG
jgi:transposase